MNTPKILHPTNVLLGVDGSEHCRAGINLLKDLPCLLDSSVRAVSVLNTGSPLLKVQLQASLEDAREQLSGGCAAVDTELCLGHAAEMLVDAAEEYQSDLIVVGATGLRSTLGILLGGVAQQVVEHAGCPVLVMRAPYQGLREILVAVDGSPYSQRALEYISQFSLPSSAHVRLCTCVTPLGLPEFTAGAWPAGHEMVPVLSEREIDELEKLHEEERQRARELLERSRERLRASGVQADAVLVEGDAASEILKVARETQADLLVAGSSGMSAVRGWLMGSVSRKLVNFASGSVMIVKGPKET